VSQINFYCSYAGLSLTSSMITSRLFFGQASGRGRLVISLMLRLGGAKGTVVSVSHATFAKLPEAG
jgi:hypothetical protein